MFGAIFHLLVNILRLYSNSTKSLATSKQILIGAFYKTMLYFMDNVLQIYIFDAVLLYYK